MAGLSRTDSGRRRRILESIAGSDSLTSKPLKRLLYRLNRSATAADLSPGNVPRGSIDVTSKQSSGGRKYMKIALNPSLYDSANPSTYKVNFQDLKATKKGYKRTGRRPRQRTDLETDTSDISRHTSHLLDDTDDYGKKVKAEYPHLVLGSEIGKPAKASTYQTNNKCGYSPSKGIPKPELGPKFNIRDSAAGTLAIAQDHARRAGQVSLPPERTDSQSRQLVSPAQDPGKHADRRGASLKGPYSVPIRFQMRPQRTSLPKTPRTSLDEPRKLKDTSPVVNGKPQASSTISGTDSCAEDVQSEIDPGEIMNARSAEVIHAQGAFGYHTRPSQKPPRSGPAPTRALPSLPEGHDSAVPTAAKIESNALLPTTSRPAAATSPKTKKPKSPPKGHRYRLSPIKNNIRREASCPTLELKPSPNLTEQFPQPPQSLTPAALRSSREPSPARRNREIDVTQVMAALHLETQDSNGARAPPRNRFHRSISDLENVPLAEGTTSNLNCPEVSPLTSPDPDKDNPWQSRVERVKALKTRDMQRLCSRQDSAISPKSISGNVDTPAGADASSHEGAERKAYTQSLFLPLQDTEGSRLSTQPNSDNDITTKPISTNNAFSPIILVAEQLPCPPIHHLLPSSSPLLNPPSTLAHVSSIADPYLPLPPRHPTNTARTPSPTMPGAQEPFGSASRPHSHNSYTSLQNPSSYTAELEARVLAMEKKNLLLERAFRAFRAVIDDMSGMACGRESGCERASWGTMREEVGDDGRREGERMSGVSGVSEGGVENMLMDMQARMRRLG